MRSCLWRNPTLHNHEPRREKAATNIIEMHTYVLNAMDLRGTNSKFNPSLYIILLFIKKVFMKILQSISKFIDKLYLYIGSYG